MISFLFPSKFPSSVIHLFLATRTKLLVPVRQYVFYMESCSPTTAVEGTRSVDSSKIDLQDTTQVQEKLPQYEQPDMSKVDGVGKEQGEDDSNANKARHIPYTARDVREFAGGHAPRDETDETEENGAQFYPEGGHGWLVLVATFIAAFW